jgi:hypothetical protein
VTQVGRLPTPTLSRRLLVCVGGRPEARNQ